MTVINPPPELFVPVSPKSDARVIRFTTLLSIARTTEAEGDAVVEQSSQIDRRRIIEAVGVLHTERPAAVARITEEPRGGVNLIVGLIKAWWSKGVA